MKSKFTSKFFEGNRRRLRELADVSAPIVIVANGLVQRGADSAYTFSQEANFWYLTGIDESDLVLVIDEGEEYLIVLERSAYQDAFDGSIDNSHLKAVSGIKKVYSAEEGFAKLEARIKKTKKIATTIVPLEYIDHLGIYTNPSRSRVINKLLENTRETRIIDLTQHLFRMRMIKQAPEIAAIQSAIDITIDSIKDAVKTKKRAGYKFDHELEAEVSFGFRVRGAAGDAFPPIVAGGKRACVLHNLANGSPLKRNELVVIDVGAEVEHYAADITRTISLGKPTKRQIEVHAAVLDIQQFAFGILKPGTTRKQYEHEVEKYMGAKLCDLGLLNKPTHKKIRHYYPHSTSHFLGLNVHDAGDYESPFETGTVMTVEPGIYIPEEGIGIRIEDDVLITKNGIKILSEKLPRDLV